MLPKSQSGITTLLRLVSCVSDGGVILCFQPSLGKINYDAGTCRFDATARLSEMVSQSAYENDADRAAVSIRLATVLTHKPGSPRNDLILVKIPSKTGLNQL